MKFVDEFRDPAAAKTLQLAIHDIASSLRERLGRSLQIMEFCGGHTHTIFRYGIEKLLPSTVELVHGPGCPVCVLPMGRVDDCVTLAETDNVIFTSFGDAIRVPGSKKSLQHAKAEGADVRIVYSPLDALELAKANPDKEVIFFAQGFETTMPSTAFTVLEADAEGVDNFSVFCNHITTVPTLKAILDSPGMVLDGFLAPGHVCMVVGDQPLQFVADDYAKPIVITGFEPLDILHSLYMVLEQIREGVARVDNQYRRVVRDEGNHPSLEAIAQVFELRSFFEWRGLGSIDHSGVRIRETFAHFDAERKFAVHDVTIADPKSCQCGEVLKGQIKPWECKIFGNPCTPDNPTGALMVSSEGACAAYYKYGGMPEAASAIPVIEVQ